MLPKFGGSSEFRACSKVARLQRLLHDERARPQLVEIIRPLDRDTARTRAGLRETFVLVGIVAGTLLGLTILFVLTSQRR